MTTVVGGFFLPLFLLFNALTLFIKVRPSTIFFVFLFFCSFFFLRVIIRVVHLFICGGSEQQLRRVEETKKGEGALFILDSQLV